MRQLNILKVDFDKKRNYGLDILRALAIFFVLNAHSAYFFTANSFLFKGLTFFNLDGVALFFVLSGFLIGGILIKAFDGQPTRFRTLFNFWIRRWFRTLPNYFLILTILVLLSLHYKTITTFSQVKSYYYFFANFKDALRDYLFPESWSLAVEEWFYLLIPVFIFLLVAAYRFKPKSSFLIVAVLIIVSVTAFRYYRLMHWPHITNAQIDSSFRKQVCTQLDSIMFGFIGAFLAHYYSNQWKKFKKTLFFLGIFLSYFSLLHYVFGYFGVIYYCVFIYTIQSIGFLCLFPLVTELKSGQGFVYRMVTRMSIISYSVYLINYSLVKYYMLGFLNRHFFNNLEDGYRIPVQYCSFWLITIVGSILLYKYFERPFMALRDIAF